LFSRLQQAGVAMIKFRVSVVILALVQLCCSPLLAGEPRTREELAEGFPGIEVQDIHDSPVAGLYELTLGPQVAYVSTDGRYLVKGEVIDLEAGVNLTEAHRVGARGRLISELDPADLIIFTPADPARRHFVVTVFTDIDCGYCRAFHRNIQRINDLGIEVRYLLFPRGGPGTEAWQKAARVWCAKDRNAALTAAKNDQDFPTSDCDASAVTHQFELGEILGLQGTPAILSERGDYLGGYLAPQELALRLEKVANSEPGAN
jgi:thiol:disulfide interchange protein DsbC